MAEELVKPIRFKIEPKASPEIGLEKERALVNLLAKDEGLVGNFDFSKIEKFRDISNKREEIYRIFDDMAKDVIISSALDMYAEDATEYGENGKIIWAESEDTEIAATVNYLLDTLKLDQNAWQYMYYLVKYGDLYIQTFRATDLEDSLGRKNLLNNANPKTLKEDLDNKRTKLEEGVIVNMYGDNDRLQEYVELVQNPAEVFDLVKRGKTVGFLKTKVNTNNINNNTTQDISSFSYNYNYRDQDIKLYDPTKFIHIYLPDTTSRSLEYVNLFNIDEANSTNKKSNEDVNFSARRGKSILYDLYKIYREVTLMQDSILLNRLTKSSLVRIFQVEVGEMGKQQAHQLLQRIKSLFEQKMAINEGTGMGDYNNPGAIERNVYLQTRGGRGAVQIVPIGGDFDPGQLTDLDYFNNMLFAGLKIPKQFLSFTDDAAGFSGGQSLMRINSRYSKTVKRFKNAFMQGIKTLINVFLLDRGLDSYVNNFTIKMQSPSTQEDTERAETQETRLRIVDQTINLFTEVEGVNRVKLTKILLSDVITNTDALDFIQEVIEEMEAGEEAGAAGEEGSTDSSVEFGSSSEDTDTSTDEGSDELGDFELGDGLGSEEDSGDELPNPSDMGIDFTDNEE